VRLFSLDHSANYRSQVAAERAIGVDVGGTKMAAGLVDREGRVERRLERTTSVESQEAFLESLHAVVEELLDEGVAALGFGIPSTIDQRSGHVVSSVHIPLADLDLRNHMAQRYGRPVAIDNDGNASASALWRNSSGPGSRALVSSPRRTGIYGTSIL